jgi:hypothetical protein
MADEWWKNDPIVGASPTPAPAPTPSTVDAPWMNDPIVDAPAGPGPAPVPTVPAPPAAAPPQQPVDDRPWYSKAGRFADDLARLAANTVTLGGADRLAGWAGGEGVEAERAKTEAARQRAGWYGTAAEVGSAFAAPWGRLSRLAPGGVLGRTAAAGLEGAGIGAAGAALQDKDISAGATTGAIFGAAGQPVSEALAGAARGAAGLLKKRPELPGSQAIRDVASQAYNRADAAGVVVRPDYVRDLQTKLHSTLANEAYSPRVHPGVKGVLDEIGDLSGQNVTLRGLENIRKLASGLRSNQDRETARLGGVLVNQLDDALANINQSHVLMGNTTQGTQALNEARKGWATGRKAEVVENLLERAQRRADAGTVSLDAAVRQEAKNLANSGATRGWNTTEKAQLAQVMKADGFENTLRGLGKIAPSMNPLNLTLQGLALFKTSGVSAAGSALGAIAAPLADKAAQNRVYSLARTIQQGNPLPPNAVERLADNERDALRRILVNWGIGPANEAGFEHTYR